MADLQARIEQFRFMAQANPNDELAFFSLGRALMDADNAADVSFEYLMQSPR